MNDDIHSLAKLAHQDLLHQFNVTDIGLKSFEAKQRQHEYGLNVLEKTKKRSALIQSLQRSLNPLVFILLIASSISFLTGNTVESVIIIMMVVISVIIDYVQTHRSLIAMESLQAQVAAMATAKRDNEFKDIPAVELVPGDIIRLSAGDLVPADAILLTAKDCHVQQGALTGESLPIEKEVNTTAQDANIVYSGSSVISGIATALIVKTGSQTEYGQIAKNLMRRAPRTEFENGIVRFGLFISKTILFLVLFVFVFSIMFKRNLLESLLFSIALAVGLTPEFLPMITTVTLASGAMAMARQKVIVKNLASMQNFGSIDILCSDKTGTLTTGEMVLEKIIDITGNSSQRALLFAYLNSSLQSGIKNPINDAVLHHVNTNPLDSAILRHEHPDVQPYHKIDEIPLDLDRRCTSVVVDKSGEHLLITKGAPESVLKMCTHYELNGQILALNDAFHHQSEALYQSLSTQGYRVLAVGYKQPAIKEAYQVQDECELTLLGFLVFADPPLKDAGELIQSLNDAGVKVKVLTGDNELVAKNICQQIGIDPKLILLGSDIEHMTDEALMLQAEEALLFARVTPTQKQRIITVLRRHGHVVGYIGDGINDAPSLHIADVGISVANAVDIAKESAEIILLERNLKVLLNGILEGRKSFGNIMKYLMMGTSSNFGNMFSMAGAILFLPFLPMLPSQILFNNLLYDLSQLPIPTDKVDEQFIRKPRHWDIDIIRRFMLYIGPISSVFDFLTFYVMIKIFSANEAMFQTGWFVESLATQTLVIFIIRTAKNPFTSRPSIWLTLSVCAVVGIGIILPFSPIAPLLGFVPLPLNYFIFLVCATIVYLGLVQMIKQKLMWRWLS
jgi:Mg2+-importing ATPase